MTLNNPYQNSLWAIFLASYKEKFCKPFEKDSDKKLSSLLGFSTIKECKGFFKGASLSEINRQVTKIPAKSAVRFHPSSVKSMYKLAEMTVIDRIKQGGITGHISVEDIKHFTSHGYKNMPESLSIVINSIYDNTEPCASFINNDDADYILNNIWDSVSINAKLATLAHHHENTAQLSDQQITDAMSSINFIGGEIEKCDIRMSGLRKLILASIARNLITTKDAIGRLSNVITNDRIFTGNLKGKDFESNEIFSLKTLIWLNSENGVSDEDSKAIKFYMNQCMLVDDAKVTRGANKELDAMLNSKSALAAPMLATYLLNKNKTEQLSPTKLLSALYRITKKPEFIPLANKMESISNIDISKGFTDTDLSSEFYAATLLTRATAPDIRIKSEKAMSFYSSLLIAIANHGHYNLVLNESSRYISLTKLGTPLKILSDAFSTAIENISDDDIAIFTNSQIDAIYITLRHLIINTSKINHLIPSYIVSSMDKLNSMEGKKTLRSLEPRPAGMSIKKFCHELGYDGKATEDLHFALATVSPKIMCTKDESSEISTLRSRLITRGKEGYYHKFAYGETTTHVRTIDIGYMTDSSFPLYNKISDIVTCKKTCSKEVILTMEELGIVADDIIHCHKDWFLAKKKQNGEHYLFGNIKSVKEIIDFFIKFEPTVINIFDLKEMFYRSGLYGAGTLRYRYTKIAIRKTSPKILSQTDDSLTALKSLKISKYDKANSLADISEKLAPKFEYLGFEFNAGGTDYFA